jgi:hypothetical protein
MMAGMPDPALVARVKELLALAKSGKVEESYAGYRALFQSPEFPGYSVEDRRACIKLVVNAKVPPSKPAAYLVESYRSAMKPLEDMIGEQGHPADFELLGICCVVVGEDKRAAELFRTGLRLERERNPQSDLCGSLMKWFAAV